MTTPPAPARLFVILAREAPVGVIFRRGPARWVQLIHWDTANDVFTAGQWFKGKVYERRSDLSPDGSLLIYFAHKYKPSDAYGKDMYAGGAWTAISKPPYLTALALWDSHIRWGGGVFETNHSILLNTYNAPLKPEHQLPADFKIDAYPPPHAEMTDPDPHMYRFRLQRDGWQLVESSIFYRQTHYYQNSKLLKSLWRKTNRTFTIEQAVGHDWKFSEEDEYRISDSQNEKLLAIENVMWVDFEQQGRLVLAKEGKLFTVTRDDNGHINIRELADFNAHEPDPQPSPEWARYW